MHGNPRRVTIAEMGGGCRRGDWLVGSCKVGEINRSWKWCGGRFRHFFRSRWKWYGGRFRHLVGTGGKEWLRTACKGCVLLVRLRTAGRAAYCR